MRAKIGALLVLWATSLSAADWPQWRGPTRDGVYPWKGLPDLLPEKTPEPRWRRELGGGYSGIAVAEGRVYTMDYHKEPKEIERVVCLDSKTGKVIWTHPYPVRYGKMAYGNGPRSTPTVYEGKVYTFGARGHLFCLHAETGKVIWSSDTVEEHRAVIPEWGHACSPFIDGRKLIVQIGGRPEASLAAFDKETGKVLWKSLGDRPGYSSPMIFEGKGRRWLGYWSPENIVALDPESGEVQWKVPFPIKYDVSITDLVWHNGVLLASDYWSGSKALTLDAKGRNPKVIWEGRRLSMLMSTPLWRDGHVYALDKSDGIKCIELRTGKVKWEGYKVALRGRNPQASLVWIDSERALIYCDTGMLKLAKLTPGGYEELSEVPLLETKTWAHPAFSDGHIYLRTDDGMHCFPLTKAVSE